MKNLNLLFLLLMITVCNVSAKDYQSLYSNRICLFDTYEHHFLYGIRVDSVKMQQSDSVFYMIDNIKAENDTCFNPCGPSIMGNEVIVGQHWDYFINQKNDTLKIKTDAKFHESWVMFKNADLLMDAVVAAHDTMNILGRTDSVKTIEFNAYGTKTGKLTHGLIKLSNKYGLISFYNMDTFPGDDYQGPSNYVLAGIDQPQMGVQNLTWKKVFDFQPGDELHTVESQISTWAGPASSSVVNTILRYKERNENADSIVYKINVSIQMKMKSGNDSSYQIFPEIEVEQVINNNLVFDLLPRESYINDEGIGSMNMVNEAIKVKSYGNIVPFNPDFSCWTHQVNYISDVCEYGDSWAMEGLGGPYYYFNSGCREIEKLMMEKKLVYYKKNNVTWGTPLVISALNPVSVSEITVIPDPQNKSLRIDLNGVVNRADFKLVDLSGKVISAKILSEGLQVLEFPLLKSGYYLYHISNGNSFLKSGKYLQY